MTPAAARERLTRLAAGVEEPSLSAAVARFLERVAALEDSEQLRDALVLAGAEAVMREARLWPAGLT